MAMEVGKAAMIAAPEDAVAVRAMGDVRSADGEDSVDDIPAEEGVTEAARANLVGDAEIVDVGIGVPVGVLICCDEAALGRALATALEDTPGRTCCCVCEILGWILAVIGVR